MEGNMNDSFLENNDAEKFKNEYLECSENFTNAFLETQQAKININNKKAIWNETVNKINEAENQLTAMNDPYQLFEEKMEQSYLDPDDEILLKSFTTKFFGILNMPSVEPSEDETAPKKARMESEE
ncbi:hypothetical protein L5515_018123 [Caenorhabditis briggsae]|uniref:Uncharacterized protein n=1 Tax=Caenorhabditis briggsae TaxID=6238 RepID=A0AAE9FLF2_CAEBR|nr:hypothetical protein L5515_018123 [Caenorhabditis briggsae]